MTTEHLNLWGKRGVIFYDPEKAEFVGVTPEVVERWQAAFPLVEVSLELKRAALWCQAGGVKRQKQNYGSFLLNWLNRSSDQRELGGRAPMPRLGNEFERAVGL